MAGTLQTLIEVRKSKHVSALQQTAGPSGRMSAFADGAGNLSTTAPDARGKPGMTKSIGI
jgi:hypothetical protein